MPRPRTHAAPSWLRAFVTMACFVVLLAGCAQQGRRVGPSPSLTSTAMLSATPAAPATASPIATGVVGSTITSSSSIATPLPSAVPPEAQAVSGLAGTGLVLERAPIESLELRVAGSAAPEHYVDVTSGLPNGCARFYGYELARAGNTITVTVWNTMPADIRAACTMQYGVTVHAVPLGANLVPGRQYTLKINDRDTTFIAR